MSLILAHHTPKGAVVVADTLVTYHGGAGLSKFRPKISVIGSGPTAWIVGFAGDSTPIWRMERAMRATLADESPESALLRAFNEVLPLCGPQTPGQYPHTGASAILVHAGGVLVMNDAGTIEPPIDGDLVALGCAEEFSYGWWAARRRYAARCDNDGQTVALVAMEALMDDAKHHFPGIGGDTTVLRLEWP